MYCRYFLVFFFLSTCRFLLWPLISLGLAYNLVSDTDYYSEYFLVATLVYLPDSLQLSPIVVVIRTSKFNWISGAFRFRIVSVIWLNWLEFTGIELRYFLCKKRLGGLFMAISNIMVMLGRRLIYRRFEGEKRFSLSFFLLSLLLVLLKSTV